MSNEKQTVTVQSLASQQATGAKAFNGTVSNKEGDLTTMGLKEGFEAQLNPIIEFINGNKPIPCEEMTETVTTMVRPLLMYKDAGKTRYIKGTVAYMANRVSRDDNGKLYRPSNGTQYGIKITSMLASKATTFERLYKAALAISDYKLDWALTAVKQGELKTYPLVSSNNVEKDQALMGDLFSNDGGDTPSPTFFQQEGYLLYIKYFLKGKSATGVIGQIAVKVPGKSYEEIVDRFEELKGKATARLALSPAALKWLEYNMTK